MKIVSLIITLWCMAIAMPAAAALVPPPERYMQSNPFSSTVDVTTDLAMVAATNGGVPIPCFTVIVPGPCNLRAVVSLESAPKRQWISYTHYERPGACRFIIPIPSSAMGDGETAKFIMRTDVRLHRYEKRSKPVGSLRYIYVDDNGEQHQCEARAVLERKGSAIAPAAGQGVASPRFGNLPEIWLNSREDITK